MTDRQRTEDEHDIAQVEAMIAVLPAAAQRRVTVIADILRELLAKDDSGEAMLAFTLVLAEVSIGTGRGVEVSQDTRASDDTELKLPETDGKCLKCGKDALDTGWECTECGYDNRPWYYPQGEQK